MSEEKWVEWKHFGESKYRTLFQNMQEGFLVQKIIYDQNQKPIDYIICDINTACLKLFNIQYAEVINKSIREMFPNVKATNPYLLTVYADCVKEARPIEKEVEINDGLLWYRISCFTIEGDFIFTSISDMTDWKKSNAEIQKLYYAIEQSSNAILISDYEGFIEYVNPKFEKVTGYSLEEIKGKNPNMLISEMSVNNYKELRQRLSSGREWSGELLSRKKSGEHYWALVTISPIRNKSGEIVNLIAIEEDISELKLLQQDLEIKNEQLTKTLEDLKQTQSRLVQNEKLAGIGQLAAGVAHEVNNPLGFVTSNFEILKKYLVRYEETLSAYIDFKNFIKEEKLDETISLISQIEGIESKNKLNYVMDDMPELFKDIEDGLDRIKKIVQGLRTFSRVDYLDSFEDYDLNSGIETTLLIANNEIKYYTNVEKNLDEVPSIPANGSQINQVILNIIVNAVHAIRSKEGLKSGMISIKTYYDSEYVYCEIQDNGIGMDSDTQSHIFDPFFTTKEIGEGTGLGLSISHDIIVNKHKGDISVESHVNEGTTFIIKLPRSLQENR